MCSSFELKILVASLLFSIALMWSYVSTKRTGFTSGLCCANVALGGPELDLEMFLLNYFSLDPFFIVLGYLSS